MKNPVVYVSMSKCGYDTLKILLENKKKIDIIVTLKTVPTHTPAYHTDFKALAEKYKIDIYYVDHIKSLIKEFQKQKPTVIIVNGWSQILNSELLKTTKYGCVGTHWAILPKNRGTAAIPWHFINEEKYGGMTLFYMDNGIDSGPIIDHGKFKITNLDNASSYYEKSSKICSKLILKHFDKIILGKAKSKIQNNKIATYLLKRVPKDSLIDFKKSAKEIFNLVRGVYNLYPLAYFTYKNQIYHVEKALLEKTQKYSGNAGQIALVKEDFLWVLAKDKIITLTNITDKNGAKITSLKKIFKLGENLNEL